MKFFIISQYFIVLFYIYSIFATKENYNYKMILLQKILDEKGLTSKVLAKKTGLTPATISSILNGKSSPKVDTLEVIAKALEVPIESFFSEESEVIHIIRKNKLHTFYSMAELKSFVESED